VLHAAIAPIFISYRVTLGWISSQPFGCLIRKSANGIDGWQLCDYSAKMETKWPPPGGTADGEDVQAIM